jgi:hypothetical protein
MYHNQIIHQLSNYFKSNLYNFYSSDYFNFIIDRIHFHIKKILLIYIFYIIII